MTFSSPFDLEHGLIKQGLLKIAVSQQQCMHFEYKINIKLIILILLINYFYQTME